jgi:hypothetical protein
MSTEESRREKIEHLTIWHLVAAISTMCACKEDTLIDTLTGYAWDEEEARKIKVANVDVMGRPLLGDPS